MILVSLGTTLHAAPPLAQSGAVAKGVGLSLRGKDASRPAAQVQIDEVKVGAQRRGFFRVAALPLVVAEGVAIRFRVADPTALADLPDTFASVARTDALELRRVAWFAPGQEQPQLRAAMVAVDDSDTWRLSDIEWADGTRAAEATLTISGKDAGLVSWTAEGPQHRALLPTTPSP